MLDFRKELERFEPLLDVERIEERIDKDDMKDLMDILKEFNLNKESSTRQS